MKLLLDTHIFLWYINGDNRLSEANLKHIRDVSNETYLSVISLWEIIVKYQIGKLELPQQPNLYIPEQRERHKIKSLAIDEVSVKTLISLPSIHRDPFDRMLICQAITSDLTIVTIDPLIRSYPVKVI